jgi:hypothetical protein
MYRCIILPTMSKQMQLRLIIEYIDIGMLSNILNTFMANTK